MNSRSIISEIKKCTEKLTDKLSNIDEHLREKEYV